MPRPEKDYPLALRKDIVKLTQSMHLLEEKRLRLVHMYEAYTKEPFPRNLLTIVTTPDAVPAVTRTTRKSRNRRRRAA